MAPRHAPRHHDRENPRHPALRAVVTTMALGSLALVGACGVADPSAPGRCTKGTSSGTVAGGKDWKIDVKTGAVSILCTRASEEGNEIRGVIQIISVTKDSTDLPIGGVSIGATAPENGGIVMVTKDNIEVLKSQVTNRSGAEIKIYPSDEYTDTCGVALFTFVYTCPYIVGLAVGGPVTIFSGAVVAEPVNVTVEVDDNIR